MMAICYPVQNAVKWLCIVKVKDKKMSVRKL